MAELVPSLPKRIISNRPPPAADEIVMYVDESGTHDMENIDPTYPVLTIAGCCFSSADFAQFDVSIQRFKSAVLGKPKAGLHSRDMRKWEGPFSRFVTQHDRTKVMGQVGALVAAARCTIITTTIRKDRLRASYTVPLPPYELAVQYTIERFYRLLRGMDIRGAVHVEARGRREDKAIDRVYEDIRANGFTYATPQEMQLRLPGPITFGLKQHRCAGLELADLVANPVACRILNPTTVDSRFQAIQPKLYAGNRATIDYVANPDGTITCGGTWFANAVRHEISVARYGLKVFP